MPFSKEINHVKGEQGASWYNAYASLVDRETRALLQSYVLSSEGAEKVIAVALLNKIASEAVNNPDFRITCSVGADGFIRKSIVKKPGMSFAALDELNRSTEETEKYKDATAEVSSAKPKTKSKKKKKNKK